MNDRLRLEQYIAETSAEIASMKAIVTTGVRGLTDTSRVPRPTNEAFRRVIELGPQLVRVKARLAAIAKEPAAPLSLHRTGPGYTIDGLPRGCAAQLLPEGNHWLLIVKMSDERLSSWRFATPFDAVTALQSEVDPTKCVVREDIPGLPR